MLTTYVALLRGVNVGGKNKVPMNALADIFLAMGCRDVRTYIQSGNVIFRATPKLAAQLPGVIPERIEERFGFIIPVVLRSAEKLSEMIPANPFVGAEESALHMFFLAHEPSPESISKLDPNRSPGDLFQVRGADVFMWLGNGVADTKLTNAYFDRKLGTVSTGRNWRTVLKLRDLMAE